MDARTLCLGVLVRGDASGYEIRKAFEDGSLGYIQDAGYGSIYPALNGLVARGHATLRGQARDRGPAKKVYGITPAGRLAFLDALAEPCGFDRLRSDFLFRMLFAELLPARELEAALASHLDGIRTRLRRLTDCESCVPAGAGDRFVYGFGLAMYRAAEAYLEAHGHELLHAALTGARPPAAAE